MCDIDAGTQRLLEDLRALSAQAAEPRQLSPETARLTSGNQRAGVNLAIVERVAWLFGFMRS